MTGRWTQDSGLGTLDSGLTRGFTVVELLVVLVMVGVTLGVVGPAFVARDSAPDGVDVVLRLIERTKRTAIASARTTTLVIDPTAARAWVRSGGAAPAIDTSFAMDLPPTASMTSAVARPTFTFDADGGGTSGELHVNDARRSAAISVDPWTGEIRRVIW